MPGSKNRNGAVQLSLRFRFLGLIIVLAGGLALVPVASTPAQADSYTVVNAANPVHAYRGQTPTSGLVFQIEPGAIVNIVCQSYGAMTAKGTNIWDLVTNPTAGNGLDGWISDYYASTPVFADFSPGIPRCGEPIPPPPTGGIDQFAALQAFSRAASQVGQVYQPDGVTPWNCYCDHFVAYAYGHAASGYASALDHYYDLLHRGLIHYRAGETPPFGALVFWKTSADGHVAFSLGTGLVISTPLKSDCGASGTVFQIAVSSIPHYLGWAPPVFNA